MGHLKVGMFIAYDGLTTIRGEETPKLLAENLVGVWGLVPDLVTRAARASGQINSFVSHAGIT